MTITDVLKGPDAAAAHKSKHYNCIAVLSLWLELAVWFTSCMGSDDFTLRLNRVTRLKGKANSINVND